VVPNFDAPCSVLALRNCSLELAKLQVVRSKAAEPLGCPNCGIDRILARGGHGGRGGAEPQPIIVSSSAPNAGNKKNRHHAEVRNGTLRFKGGRREQFVTAGANNRHQQTPCPLTPEIPLRLHRDLRGHRARLLPVFNDTG
jgi:hypothetical protein